MKNRNYLDVYLEKRKVGTLALLKDRRVAFEYSDEWLLDGYSISPLSLPLIKKVFVPDYNPFEGLFGVFNDSLSDGFGRLLTDRFLRKKGIDPFKLNSLDRLALIGRNGMGALSYKPQSTFNSDYLKDISLDELAQSSSDILDSDNTKDIDELFMKGGSSGGARPKVYQKIDNKEYIVKFMARIDRKNKGLEEYEYMACAKECGIEVADFKLLPSKYCDGFFATERFDRKGKRRIHMISASGLLETSHRIPNLDYDILMKLTLNLTGDYQELLELYKRMCFNVFAHNRDDHSKNFSYLYVDNKWRLSPAYDLTYSSSLNGEHATTINGNGKDPGLADILEIAKRYKLDLNHAKEIALDIQAKTRCLRKYFE